MAKTKNSISASISTISTQAMVLSGVKKAKRRRARRATAGPSERDLAAQHVHVHHPVADEAVERILEGGRLVLLEEEVPDPGAGVAAEEGAEQVVGIGAHRGQGEEGQGDGAAEVVQAAADHVGMLAQVKRVELAEAGECRRHGRILARSAAILRPAG